MSKYDQITEASLCMHHWTSLDRLKAAAYGLVSEDRKTDTAVIFVHGFLGDARGTWLNFQEMIDSYVLRFPHWSTADAYFFSYESFLQSITDSAEELLSFTHKIFPKPPGWLFSVPAVIRHIPGFSLIALKKRTYKRLILVGHSEGAVVIRRAIVVAYKRTGGKDPILGANLALFAPAHLGFTPSGWLGACLALGKVEELTMTILGFSPSFTEMRDKTLLHQIQQDTAELRRQAPNVAAFEARVLFGLKDYVVVKAEYTWDKPDPPDLGQDHVSVCKPRTGYVKPLEFVIR
jgi:triacylglycerol esterase/lipase EstA (alpha/beta hydrolase family)